MKPLSRTLLAVLLSGVSLASAARPALLADDNVTPPTAAAAPADAATKAAPVADSGLTPQILFQFLLAEIAASRGQLPLASAQYVDLAKRTRDVRIARRAAEVSFYGQQYANALEATRLWSTLEPESDQASHAYWALLAAAGRWDELATQLGRYLQDGPGEIGTRLMQVPRIYAGVKERTVASNNINRVTEPWLNQAEARFIRAQGFVGANDEAAARTEIDEAIRLKPDWSAAVVFKAQLQSREPLSVIPTLTEFIQRNPGARDVRLALARLQVEAKQYKESRESFRILLESDPENPDLMYAVALLSLQLGDGDTAEKPLKKLLNSDFKDKDAIRFYLAQIAEHRKAGDEAIAYFDAVGGSDVSRITQSRIRAAELLRAQGKIDAALIRLKDAASANTAERTQLILAQSQLLSESKRFNEAWGVLTDGLATTPEDPVLLYEAAMLGERTQRFADAEKHLRRLIGLKPDHAHALNALGYSLADRNERLEEAQALIDKALSLDPDDPFILDSRGWLAFRRGELSAAEQHLRRAYGLRPDPEIAAHLGEVLWQQGRKDEARALLQAAVKTDPANEALNATIKRLTP